MTRTPPLAGRLLLRLVLPPREVEHVAGDLQEEWITVRIPRLGEVGARYWYLREVVRSAGPVLLYRLGRGEFLPELLLAFTLTLGSYLAVEFFWGLVLSLVPLRAAAPAPGFVMGSIVVAGVVAASSGFFRTRAVLEDGVLAPLLLVAGVPPAAFLSAWIADGSTFVPSAAFGAALSVGTLTGVLVAVYPPRPFTWRARP